MAWSKSKRKQWAGTRTVCLIDVNTNIIATRFVGSPVEYVGGGLDVWKLKRRVYIDRLRKIAIESEADDLTPVDLMFAFFFTSTDVLDTNLSAQSIGHSYSFLIGPEGNTAPHATPSLRTSYNTCPCFLLFPRDLFAFCTVVLKDCNVLRTWTNLWIHFPLWVKQNFSRSRHRRITMNQRFSFLTCTYILFLYVYKWKHCQLQETLEVEYMTSVATDSERLDKNDTY